jgi:hypothetical protein
MLEPVLHVVSVAGLWTYPDWQVAVLDGLKPAHGYRVTSIVVEHHLKGV